MHVSNKSKIVLVPTVHTYRLSPFLDSFQDFELDSVGARRGTLGEAPHELVEEVFCRDLKMEGVAAILDTDVEELDIISGGNRGAGGGYEQRWREVKRSDCGG